MNQGAIELSVVLVSFNARELLEVCLRSLENALTGLVHEIIVVDNASQDGAADMVAERFPGVRLLRNAENLGYPKAKNQGIAAAGGAHVTGRRPEAWPPRSGFPAGASRFPSAAGSTS